METSDFLKLVHLVHQLRQAINAGKLDINDLDLNKLPFNEVDDFTWVYQLIDAMRHSR